MTVCNISSCRQEVILHDSNLVMGNISMEEEMQLQEMEGSGGAAQGLC